MAGLLANLRSTVISGIILAIIMIIVVVIWYPDTNAFDLGSTDWWTFFVRWLHVLSGVMWIGLLWYFNFVQIPNMASIPDEQKPAISKVIAPSALFWFRWGAMGTIVTGVILAILNDYFVGALLIGLESGVPKDTAIGIGMWLGAIMWFNVWFIIWPNQKKALGIVEVDADTKAKAGRTAMLFSRTNTLLSIPMLYAMVSAQNLY
ncbi:MAG TPA: urate hydroxylase PuuD [Alphaproteobacteria bacterium]|nr:urate hydroxylase PuuD [Alphaproteobacteria bacterium]